MFLDYHLISQSEVHITNAIRLLDSWTGPILPGSFRLLGPWRTRLFWLPLTVHPVVVASSLCQLMTKLGQL